jgi:hypothetical protein
MSYVDGGRVQLFAISVSHPGGAETVEVDVPATDDIDTTLRGAAEAWAQKRQTT